MLGDPPVLLLDEPFAGVDPQVAVQLRGHLRGLARAGRTMLVSTHELAEANEIGDDVTVLRDGRVIGHGSPAQLRGSLVGTGYRLRIKGSGDLAGALDRAGYRPEPSGDGLIVAVAGEQAAQELLAQLITAWAATGLALLVNLLYPQLATAGSHGINAGGTGVGGIPAMLPGLGVLLVFSLWAPDVSAAELLGVAGAAVAAIAVAGVATVTRRFHPDAVLDS